MQPLSPQLEKIAVALGVSYNVLSGNDTARLRLETVCDLIGMLMVLGNSGILQISRERGKYTVKGWYCIHLNPVISSYLEIGYTTKGIAHTLSLQDVLLNIRNYKIFNDLLKREKMNYLYQTALKSAGGNSKWSYTGSYRWNSRAGRKSGIRVAKKSDVAWYFW